MPHANSRLTWPAGNSQNLASCDEVLFMLCNLGSRLFLYNSMQKRFYPVIDAAQRGGKQVKKFFGREFTVAEKTMASDVCTSADLASEKAVIATLEKYFPDHDIYSEEAGMVHKGSK